MMLFEFEMFLKLKGFSIRGLVCLREEDCSQISGGQMLVALEEVFVLMKFGVDQDEKKHVGEDLQALGPKPSFTPHTKMEVTFSRIDNSMIVKHFRSLCESSA